MNDQGFNIHSRPSTALPGTWSRSISLKGKAFGSSLFLSREKDITTERDQLERKVQERDEEISSLQKNVEVQNSHILKLHAQIEDCDRKEKQHETRHKVQLESMVSEHNMLKSQLQLMQDEVTRIKSDPLHMALTSDEGVSFPCFDPDESDETPSSPAGKTKIDDSGNESHNDGTSSGGDTTSGNASPSVSSSSSLSERRTTKGKVKLANNAQGILLQSQLYQAINSLTQLREQTVMMKENYDAIVKSLQDDLTYKSDLKAKQEAKLLNQLYKLEQTKKVSLQSLQDELKMKDGRITRLEERLRELEMMDENNDNNNHNGGDMVDGEGTNDKNKNKSDNSNNSNVNSNDNNPVKVIKRDDIQVTRKSLIAKKQKPNGIRKSKSFTPSTNTQQKDFPFIGKSVNVPPSRSHSSASTSASASASASASRSTAHSHSTASSKSRSRNTASPVSNLSITRGLSPPPPIILEETAESEEEGSGTSKGKGGSKSGSGSGSDRSSTGSRSSRQNMKKNKRPSPRGIVDAAFLLDEDLKSSITAPTGPGTCTGTGTGPQQETGKEQNINVDDNQSHGDDTEYALSAIM